MTNDPQVLATLLRSIADSSDAKESKHDIIFNAAAALLAEMPRIILDAFVGSETFLGSTQTLMRKIDELEKSHNTTIEECAVIADGFACGLCGMDGKAGAAIRDLKKRRKLEESCLTSDQPISPNKEGAAT